MDCHGTTWEQRAEESRRMQHPWMAPPAHIPRSTGPDPAAGTFYMQARLARGSIHVHRRCKDQAWYLGSPVLTPRQVHSKFDCFPERARAHGPWIETFQGYTGHTGRSQHGKWILRRSGLSHAECCLKPETRFPFTLQIHAHARYLQHAGAQPGSSRHVAHLSRE